MSIAKLDTIYYNIIKQIQIRRKKVMKHPEYALSHDLNNNCTIIKWGESGYYSTNYPQGVYNDEIIDELNTERGITKAERKAMELCSIAAQNNPDLDWEQHYEEVMSKVAK
jgi:hypothetical protein